jgi:hypothetical protein
MTAASGIGSNAWTKNGAGRLRLRAALACSVVIAAPLPAGASAYSFNNRHNPVFNGAGIVISGGSQAIFITNSDGAFDISQLTSGGTTAGSIAGAGELLPRCTRSRWAAVANLKGH